MIFLAANDRMAQGSSSDADRPGWQAIVDDEGCSLTMNDFPAEPLYTVRWRDQQLDFDDSPQCWSIPFGENEFRAT